ncbi:hypothetical protein [Bosea beijingensis]|uniref:hypothetical protein n=1 Tax=Bosea beijingensis TaxID=3068632 RepID=UPI002741892D|nr:hypothetical protein [Bosea sp. REN20]
MPKPLPSPSRPRDSFFPRLTWFAAWRNRRREAAALVERDAAELIEEHGVQAYGVAKWRAHQVDRGKLVDDCRPAGHWRAVSRRVAKLVGYETGLNSATRREL